MEKEKMKMYESPQTVRTQVCLESGICASSNEDVVKDDNDNVNIGEQEQGGDFEFGNWN